jgi:hypothetical protein
MSIALAAYRLDELYSLRELAAHGFDAEDATGHEDAEEILPRVEQEIDQRLAVRRRFEERVRAQGSSAASTEIEFDDGTAITELVWADDHFLGVLWTEGKSLEWCYRRVDVVGQWSGDAHAFTTRQEALDALVLCGVPV